MNKKILGILAISVLLYMPISMASYGESYLLRPLETECYEETFNGNWWKEWDNTMDIFYTEGDYDMDKIKMIGTDGEPYETINKVRVYTYLPYANFNRIYVFQNALISLYKYEGFMPILVDAREYGIETTLVTMINFDRPFPQDDDLYIEFDNAQLTFEEADVYMLAMSIEVAVISSGGMVYKDSFGYTYAFEVGGGGDYLA